MSLSWVNDRVEGPCQPGAWTRDLPNLQFTPPGQRGRGKGRNVDGRRNEAVTQMSTKRLGGNKTFLTTETWVLISSILWELEFLKVLFPHQTHSSSHHLSIWMTVTSFWLKTWRQAGTHNELVIICVTFHFLPFSRIVPFKLPIFWHLYNSKRENGEALTLCWQPKTELSTAPNFLKPQKVFHLCQYGLWRFGDPGPQRARRNISAGSIR